MKGDVLPRISADARPSEPGTPPHPARSDSPILVVVAGEPSPHPSHRSSRRSSPAGPASRTTQRWLRPTTPKPAPPQVRIFSFIPDPFSSSDAIQVPPPFSRSSTRTEERVRDPPCRSAGPETGSPARSGSRRGVRVGFRGVWRWWAAVTATWSSCAARTGTATAPTVPPWPGPRGRSRLGWRSRTTSAETRSEDLPDERADEVDRQSRKEEVESVCRREASETVSGGN